jgi:hypothetical protein
MLERLLELLTPAIHEHGEPVATARSQRALRLVRSRPKPLV